MSVDRSANLQPGFCSWISHIHGSQLPYQSENCDTIQYARARFSANSDSEEPMANPAYRDCRHSAIRPLASMLLASVFLTFAGAASVQSKTRIQYCAQLEGQLAKLQRGRSSRSAKSFAAYDKAYKQQKRQIRSAQRKAKADGCIQTGFLFRRKAGPSCKKLMPRLNKMEANLAKLDSKRSRFSSDPRGRQRQRLGLLAELGNNKCGDQYAQFSKTRIRSRSNTSFFGALFGGGNRSKIRFSGIDDIPQVGTFRTLCVRKCDGYYFPISFATTQSGFARDEGLCKSNSNQLSDVSLFIHANPGENSDQMVSLGGTPYKKLSYAFRYRTEYVAECHPAPGVAKLLPLELVSSTRNKGKGRKTKSDGFITIPLPTSHQDIFIDPDTLEAMETGFQLTRLSALKTSTENKIVTASNGKRVRIVGPAFYPVQ